MSTSATQAPNGANDVLEGPTPSARPHLDQATEPHPLPPMPLPSSSPASALPASVMIIVEDDRAIQRLIETLLDRSGLTQSELARRLGITFQSLNQYKYLRRKRPSVQWFTRLAHACGARVVLEFPSRPIMPLNVRSHR